MSTRDHTNVSHSLVSGERMEREIERGKVGRLREAARLPDDGKITKILSLVATKTKPEPKLKTQF